MDYELEYQGYTYMIHHDEFGEVYIYDENGDKVVSFMNYGQWDSGKPFPEKLAVIAISAYQEGYAEGHKSGYFSCQCDVKKVLGIA